MQKHFDEVLFKQRTREMLAFLGKKGVEIPLNLGYEAAARFLLGAESLNHLLGRLRRGDAKSDIIESSLTSARDRGIASIFEEEVVLVGGVRSAAKLQYKYRAVDDGRELFLDVVIRSFEEDAEGGILHESSILAIIDGMSDTDLLALAAKRWRAPELFRGEARPEVLAYIRAFRPHLLVKAQLLQFFGSFEAAADLGFAVSGPSDTGTWTVEAAREIIQSKVGVPYFNSEAAAWEAMYFRVLLCNSAIHRMRAALGVLAGTGYWEDFEKIQIRASRQIQGWTLDPKVAKRLASIQVD